MATNIEWFHHTVNRLAVSDAQVELLSELKVAFSSLKVEDVTSVAAALDLSPIFDCVNTSDKQQLELACDVLEKLLLVLDTRMVLARYGPQFQRALVHPAPQAKELVLKELNRAVGEHTDMVEQFSTEEAVLISVVGCITHEEVSVSRHSIALLKLLGTCKAGLSALYSPALLEALNAAMKKSDVVRFRVYELIVAVSVQSEEGLAASDRSGLLGNLVTELQGDDVLAHLNVLEILTSLALCQHGVIYLDTQGFLSHLADKLLSSNNAPLTSFLVPGLIKFFGNVAQARPAEMMEKFPSLVSMMFEALESPDMTVMVMGMETLGYIASTLKGKYMLHSFGDKMPETLKKIVEKIPYVPLDIRVRLLNSIANILQLKTPDQNNQSLSLTKRWYEALCLHPMEFVMSLCQQPFPEIRLAGFQMMQVISFNPWGQESIARAPGAIEYLLDRSSESIKACIDAKFDIVKTLVESPSSANVFSPDTHMRLTEFVRQGKFFVIGETEVAIEGGS